MAAWVLSIVGIVSIGVLLDIIIPEGEINKYIKGIFSIVTICVIIAPLPKIIDKNFDITDYFGTESSIAVDERFVEEVNGERVAELEKSVETMLKSNGIDGVKVEIMVRSYDTLDIESVKVSVDKDGTDKEFITDLVANKLGIKKTEVRLIVSE